MTFSFRWFRIAILSVSVLILILSAACTPALGKSHVKLISSLEANYKAVYPLANTQIKCTAGDPGGGSLTYTWTCNKGIIEGNGPEITWIAPNELGWFPIMATVQNSAGQTDEQIIEIKVVEKDKNCPTCGR